MEDIDGRIIMLILFVVISGVKWFIENVKNRGQQPHETSESLEEIYDDFREEIRQRQTEVRHPQEQPVQKRQAEERHAQDIFTPHHHEFGQQSPPPLPAGSTGRPEVEYRPAPQPQPRKIRKPQLTAQEKAALANLQKRSSPTQRSTRGQSHTTPTLRQLLGSPQSARQAIVLHEILGKPRSMQR